MSTKLHGTRLRITVPTLGWLGRRHLQSKRRQAFAHLTNIKCTPTIYGSATMNMDIVAKISVRTRRGLRGLRGPSCRPRTAAHIDRNSLVDINIRFYSLAQRHSDLIHSNTGCAMSAGRLPLQCKGGLPHVGRHDHEDALSAHELWLGQCSTPHVCPTSYYRFAVQCACALQE